MKKALSIIFVMSLCLILMLSGCKENQTKNEITATEGSTDGTVVIGDYIVRVTGNPRYETGSVNEFGHNSHYLVSEIEIENNSDEDINFDKLSEMGLAIYGYKDGSYCGHMMPRFSFDSTIIEPGAKQTLELSGDNPSYGLGPADSGEYYEIEICYHGDIVSSVRYD